MDAAWTGVWKGELDGQPSVTLTLADDGGTLGGTVVLNIVERQDGGEAHAIAGEPHMLLHTQADAKTLTFQITRPDRSQEPMRFTVALDDGGKARIHCLNCGPDAQVAELAKTR
jgi:hypothetical protein